MLGSDICQGKFPPGISFNWLIFLGCKRKTEAPDETYSYISTYKYTLMFARHSSFIKVLESQQMMLKRHEIPHPRKMSVQTNSKEA